MNMYRIQPTVPVKAQAGLYSIAFAAWPLQAAIRLQAMERNRATAATGIACYYDQQRTRYYLSEFSASLQGSKDIEIRRR